MIPQHFIDELLARTDIVEVINGRVTLKKQGREYAACCPFHGEKTPSFFVSPTKQFYHCFGCGAHGTAITFLMEHDNLSFPEAIEELARLAGMEVPREQGTGDRAEDHRPLYDALEAAAEHYVRALRHNHEAVDYLKARGLTGEIARDFRLGFAEDRWDGLISALSPRFDDKTLIEAGLAIRKEGGQVYDRFRGRIMFPIRDTRGRVIGFGGRILGKGEPKYLNSPETPVFHKGQQLYGLFEARKAATRLEQLLVVEGYMDVIALAQHGITHAVATLGTSTTRDHLERLFRVVPRLVFCFDGDAAGRKAAWRALEQALPVMRDGREAAFLFLPEGEDPDTLVRTLGAEGFREREATAQALSDTFLDGLKARYDAHTREGRARLGSEGAKLLRAMPEGLLKTQLVNDLARLCAVSPEQFARQTEAHAGHDQPPPSAVDQPVARPGRRPATAGTQRLAMTPARLALALLVREPGLAAGLKDWDYLAASPVPGARLLAQVIETLRTSPHLTTAGLLERWRDSDEGRFLLKLAQWQPPDAEDAPPARMLSDALTRLRHLHDEQRASELLEKASAADLSAAEKEELKRLLSARHGGGP
ncbi:DNA primase [Thioalkalivibrio sulfidiphilus]|uniref:DNA primase n=1 Tax=Thioalkalivibrio sulfidiphilus TaxID=1033854 RepID=UPI000366320B|nr:DNA primase [Thioalkalivibrio sulfidiphilus]